MRKTLLAALGGVALLSAGAIANQASAMTFATPPALGAAAADNALVEKAAVVCGYYGCARSRPPVLRLLRLPSLPLVRSPLVLLKIELRSDKATLQLSLERGFAVLALTPICVRTAPCARAARQLASSRVLARCASDIRRARRAFSSPPCRRSCHDSSRVQ